MLLNNRKNYADMGPTLSSVHNYYEHRVFEQLQEMLPEKFSNINYMADLACVALNTLPPRYIRHDVDMAFYLNSNERLEMTNEVAKAVQTAIKFIDSSDKKYDFS